MISGVEGDTTNPITVRTAWMSAALDADYWPKHWVSGDTTFFVRPGRAPAILRTALLEVSAVRDFLERAP
jgi:hypothetical protein